MNQFFLFIKDNNFDLLILILFKLPALYIVIIVTPLLITNHKTTEMNVFLTIL